MDAAVWTAIGLLAATSLGTIFYLGSRMDALAARLDARMDAGFARVDAGFASVDSRFDAIEAGSMASLRGSTHTSITTQAEALLRRRRQRGDPEPDWVATGPR